MKETEMGIQQSTFLLSLELVESAGNTLQSAELSGEEIESAMQQMDLGLKQAFAVDAQFLKQLDIRLPKLYNEMFIPGVESYRLGVESSDRKKQLDGINLLNQWSQFWMTEKPNIQKRLIELNGQ